MGDMFADYRQPSGHKDPLPRHTDPPATPTSALSAGLQQAHGIRYEILYPGANALLRVLLPAGGTLKAESGAMVAMGSQIEVEGKLEGGLLGGLGRMFSGENFFFQTLKAVSGGGEVLLSPTALGTLQAIELNGDTGYIVQKGGFFAGTAGIQVNTSLQNLAKGLFSGQGFFILKISGQGLLFISSYGAIHPLDIPAGEEFIIDNQHLVAWPEDCHFNIEAASKGWLSSVTSGEGLVCRFRGPARVYIQTRNPDAFATWIRGVVNGGKNPA